MRISIADSSAAVLLQIPGLFFIYFLTDLLQKFSQPRCNHSGLLSSSLFLPVQMGDVKKQNETKNESNSKSLFLIALRGLRLRKGNLHQRDSLRAL